MMDLVFRNCRVIDGTGNPWYRADVGVEGDRIAAIGNLSQATAKEMIDVRGLVLSPGFIDMHSHSDLFILVEPEARQKIMQGVTTELLGQDGTSVAPIKPESRADVRRQVSGLLGDPKIEWDWVTFADYLKRVEGARASINTASLVPYGQLRQWVLGMDNRLSTEAELEAMKEQCRLAFEQGAVGISLGLIYPPCVYADKTEMVSVCEVAASFGGFLVCHIRNESDRLLESLDEIIGIAKDAGIPLHVSHLKAAGKNNWGKVEPMLKKLEAAREVDGMEITFDQYPYPAASTMLAALVPPWAHAGGVGEMLNRFKDPQGRAKIKSDMLSEDTATWENWIRNCGFDNIYVTAVETQKNKQFEGKNLIDIARARGQEPADAVLDLLLEEDNAVGMVMFWGSEECVQKVLKHDYYTAGSDGLLGGKPHPRVYGTFARVIGKYVREDKVIGLEQAVRHMSSLPAQRIGLLDRGLVRPGLAADLVIFDPATVIDTATYAEPHQHPKGIHYVVVNGQIVVRKGEHTGARSGRVLRKS